VYLYLQKEEIFEGKKVILEREKVFKKRSSCPRYASAGNYW